MDRKETAKTLRKIADLMELHGEPRGKVSAYRNAARVVERLEENLGELVSSGRILSVKGIGRSIASTLQEMLGGTEPSVLRELMKKTPEGLLELMELPGLGPKKVAAIWKGLGVTTLGELEYACHENRLLELPGFGAKSQSRVAQAVAFKLKNRSRRLLDQAWQVGEEICRVFRDQGVRCEVAGELRRLCETVGEVVVVAEAEPGELEFPADVKLELSEPRMWGITMLYATGSAEHIGQLEKIAASKGLTLTREGIFRQGVPIEGAVASEQDVYAALGLPWIPPELREGMGEVEAALEGRLPELVSEDDIKGSLHNHTTYSDGGSTLAEMAEAACKKGWRFLGIADHSPAAYYAGGLECPRLKEQWEEMERVASRFPLRLVRGLEADVLADGSLDVPQGCEEGLEFVVASVHSGFSSDRAAQTERILRALADPLCAVLGHPTGRLLLARPEYEVDLEAVLKRCAELGVAVEINANPHRLDLPWRWVRRAVELGVKLAISPDAHSVAGLDDLRWGVAVARKGWASASDVVGAGISLEEWLRQVAERRGF